MDPKLDYYIDDIDECINEVVISEQSVKKQNDRVISEINANSIYFSKDIYKTDDEAIISDDTYMTDNAIATDVETYVAANGIIAIEEFCSNNKKYEAHESFITNMEGKTDGESYATSDEMITDEENYEAKLTMFNKTNRYFLNGITESFENLNGYESGGSESTIPMTNSEGNSFFLDKLQENQNQEQLKDISNNLGLRPRRSITIKNEIPIENIEIKTIAVHNSRKPTKEITQVEQETPEEYYEGRLLWGKLKSYPWWPCMIYRSPEKIFYKRNSIHVVYFGPKIERGWISVNDIFSYDGKAKYDALVKELIDQKVSKKVLKDYNYPVSKIPTWKAACKEAELALFKNLRRRLKDHGILYQDASGKCTVSDLESSEEEEEVISIPSSDSHPPNSPKAPNGFLLPLVKSLPSIASATEIPKTLSHSSPHLIFSRTSSVGSLKRSSPPSVESISSSPNDGSQSPRQKSPRLTPDKIDEDVSVVSFNTNYSSNDFALPTLRRRITPENKSKFDDSASVASSRRSVKKPQFDDNSSVASSRRSVKKPQFDDNSSVASSRYSVKKPQFDDTSSVASSRKSTKKVDKFRPVKVTQEYRNLTVPSFNSLKKSLLCLLCLEESDDAKNLIISCAGQCSLTFHVNCMHTLLDYVTSADEEKPVLNYNKCVDCNKNQRRCFMCQKLGNVTNKKDMIRCSINTCGRYFHRDCLNNGVYHNIVTHNRHGSVTCPSHVCHACHLDSASTVRHASSHIRCIMCPASFHKGQWCIPAGSIEINAHYIICPQHLKFGGSYNMFVAPFMNCIKNGIVNLNKLKFKITPFNDPNVNDLWILEKPLKSTRSKPTNVAWCFICSKGGDLICCEKCPAALHQHCAQVDEIPDSFLCDECKMGKYPRYGEVLWLKCGSFRWWPAQVIHPSNAPDNILRATHGDGHFLVLFFGSFDYQWCNKTQAFMFDEADIEQKCPDSDSDDSIVLDNVPTDTSKNMEKSYRLSVVTAGRVFRRRNKKWARLMGNGNRPTHYKTIKNNIPIGKVVINKIKDVSDVHMCECRPGDSKNDRDPCGPTSSCLNRALNYECNPTYCRNGSKCQNQRFMLRQYPPLEIFNTHERGWALKTLEPIKQGTFVIEYVGEVIDVEESNRRMRTSHENNISNFYMMELDGQRIIDAGPAANISRFMNHSCSPNVSTQRWIVNGDTRVGIFALNNIAANEELTFNYNFLSLGGLKIPCKCGSSNCSGFLGVPPRDQDSQDTQTLKKHKPAKKSAVTAVPGRKAVKTKRVNTDIPPPIKKISLDIVKEVKGMVDDFCFVCHSNKCDISCNFETCPKTYHRACADLYKSETVAGQWFCPWHFCNDCGKLADSMCSFCVESFCASDLGDRVLQDNASQSMACLEHYNLLKTPQCDNSAALNTDRQLVIYNNTAITESHPRVIKLESDRHCFLCRGTKCTYRCSFDQCRKVYHSRCLGAAKKAPEVWYCPEHFCDDCGKLIDRFCTFCVESFCVMHLADRIVSCDDRQWESCLDHYDMYRQHQQQQQQQQMKPLTDIESDIQN